LALSITCALFRCPSTARNAKPSFLKTKNWPIAKCALWLGLGLGWAGLGLGLGLELVMMAARRRFSLLGKRGIINFYSREAVA
jgi:hypothetical protein